MLGAIKALTNSEKAVAGGVLVICATVLTALGHMTTDAWTSYTQWIFGIYVGGKTVQGAVSQLAPARAMQTPKVETKPEDK